MASILPRHTDNTTKTFSSLTPAPQSNNSPHLKLIGHSGSVSLTRFIPSSHLFLTSDTQSLFLWRLLETDTLQAVNLWATPLTSSAIDVASVEDEETCVLSTGEGTLLGVDLIKGSLTRKFRFHRSSACSVAFSPIFDLIASVSNDRTLCLWDKRKSSPVQVHSLPIEQISVCFSNESRKLFVGGLDGSLSTFDIDLQKIVSSLPIHQDVLSNIESIESGKDRLLTTSLDSSCKEVERNSVMKEYRGFQGGFGCGVVRGRTWGKGKLVACGGKDLVTIWDGITADTVLRMGGHKGTVTDLSFSKGGELLSGASDGSVYLTRLPSELLL